MALFRFESVAHQVDRLEGAIVIAVPVAWQTISFTLFVGLGIAALFLSVASYSRVETVSGMITLDKGVATITAPRGGVITSVGAEEGQFVSAGTVLAAIRAEEDQAIGKSTGAIMEAAIARQDASLSVQVVSARTAAAAQQGQIEAQQKGIVAEISQLETQIALQRNLVASAKRDYEKAREVANRGFLSGRDLQLREDTMLAREQQLSQLEQNIASRRSTLLELDRSASQIEAQSQLQSATIAAAQADLAQQAANVTGSRAYVLRAPIPGRATAVSARIGQTVSSQTPLMMIVPRGGKIQAELAVSSRAIGFVRPGQLVRLAIDAFPYQRFGTITGRVLTVSKTAINQRGAGNELISSYPVIVELDATTVTAFGQKKQLISGMMLTARIVTAKQTMLQWLFEPVFAVQKR